MTDGVPIKNRRGGDTSKRTAKERRAIIEHRRAQVAALCFDGGMSAQQAADHLTATTGTRVSKTVVVQDRLAIVEAWRDQYVHAVDTWIVRSLRNQDRREARLWSYLNAVDARQAKRTLLDPESGQPVSVELDLESATRARCMLIARMGEVERDRRALLGLDKVNAVEILHRHQVSGSVGVVVDLDGVGPTMMPGPDDTDGFEAIDVQALVKDVPDDDD